MKHERAVGAGLVNAYRDPFLLVAPEDADELAAITTHELPMLQLLGADEAGLSLAGADGATHRAPAVPPLCLGLIALSETGLRRLEAAYSCFSRLGAFAVPSPVQLPRDPAAFGLKLSEFVVARMKTQMAATAKLAREQSQLRAMHEDMQNAFSDLEHFVASTGLQPARLAFENLPASGALVGGPGVDLVVQTLPAPITGIAALEFHIAEPMDVVEFHVSLHTVEDHAEHMRWRLSREDLDPGWRVLGLDRAIVGLPRTSVLKFEAGEPGGGLPVLSLGAPLAHAAYRARVEGSPAAPRGALALRLWNGLPGVRPPRIEMSVSPPPTTEPARPIERVVPFPMLRGLAQLPSSWRPDFDVLELRPQIRGFQLHPGPNGLAIVAALQGVDLSEPSRFTAVARVESPDAKPIEFLLAFSAFDDAEVDEMLQLPEAPIDFPGFTSTGWLRVVHGAPKLLSLLLMPAKGKLYFATRMADRAPEWFAWATLGDLRQTFLGHNVEESSPWGEEARPALERRGFAPAPRASVTCRPPQRGIGLQCLPARPIRPATTLQAFIALDNAGDQDCVEFAIAITDLSPLGVLSRATCAHAVFPDARFRFSGWKAIAGAQRSELELASAGLNLDQANLYFLARRRTGTDGAEAIAARFDDIRVST